MPHAIATVLEFPDAEWADDAPTHDVEAVLEGGAVLSFPKLRFALSTTEQGFLSPRLSDGKAKNVSLRWTDGTAHLRGASGTADELAAVQAMLERYARFSEALALRLFPAYRGGLRRGGTTFRPLDIASRTTSWRQDDTRLHVDAFPSNPMQGTRLLRVFNNVNPDGQPRSWRVGEGFEAHAKRFLPAIARPWPGSAWLLARIGITKRRRTEYDHLMLHLHDCAKADAAFQRSSPQASVDFAPGTTWVVFSDQVLHAAMAGQHMLEQTFYLDPGAQQQPQSSPLDILERLLGRTLR